jgi:hypothetical protein
VYADDVNLLGDNRDTIKKPPQTLISASKEVGLEVNTEKTERMLLSLHQNSGQNHEVKIGNGCFETKILPVVLQVCETCSLTLSEENRACLRTEC